MDDLTGCCSIGNTISIENKVSSYKRNQKKECWYILLTKSKTNDSLRYSVRAEWAKLYIEKLAPVP